MRDEKIISFLFPVISIIQLINILFFYSKYSTANNFYCWISDLFLFVWCVFLILYVLIRECKQSKKK